MADRKEQQRLEREIDEGRAIPAGVLHAAILDEGREELARPPSALAWSGLAGGLSMGGSLLMEGLLASYLPHAGWAPLVSRLGYSVGFLIVILGRQQLFTENPITTVLPLFGHWRERFADVARLWAIVLVTNLLGAALFAAVFALVPVVSAEVRAAFARIGAEALVPGPASILLRGVVAGWLIALMVWVLPGVDNVGRPGVIVLMTYMIGLGEFSHVVAGSVQVLYLVFSGGATFAAYLGRFMLPALAGNVVGGVLLVALLNHAQVVAGGAREVRQFTER